MKKMLLLAVIILASATFAMAQRENKTRFSAGPELGIATGMAGKGWGLGLGLSGDIEHFFQENVSGDFYIGYISFAGKSAGVGIKNKNYTTIPIRVGTRYYVGNNLHFGAQLGVGINRIGGTSTTAFAYSPQIGYNFKSKNDKPLDLTFKYDGYAGNGDFSALGLRLSLIF
ncbi:MAG: hypothetical protein Q8891_13395 [Bacteroidota bacterium]|nr:hypothetical protein [Bacteroidota bacterium]